MRRATLAIALLTIFLLAACGGGASTGSSGATEVKLTLKDFEFVPKAVEMPANQLVKLDLKNTGSVEHDFVVDALKVKLLSPTGRTVSKTIGPFAPGTYDLYCAVAGHKEAGMVGTLTVR